MDKRPAPEIGRADLTPGGERYLSLFQHPPAMETARLRLRKMRRSDAEDIYAWASDPEVARYVLWDAHGSLRDTREYLRYIRWLYRHRLPASWGIELKETGRMIGTIGVMAWVPDHHCAEVGYSLGRKWWRQGYASEALAELLNRLFAEPGVNRVEAMCDVRNPASARVMEKCGMRREGILRQRVYNKGEAVDVLLYAAVRSDRSRPAFRETARAESGAAEDPEGRRSGAGE